MKQCASVEIIFNCVQFLAIQDSQSLLQDHFHDDVHACYTWHLCKQTMCFPRMTSCTLVTNVPTKIALTTMGSLHVVCAQATLQQNLLCQMCAPKGTNPFVLSLSDSLISKGFLVGNPTPSEACPRLSPDPSAGRPSTPLPKPLGGRTEPPLPGPLGERTPSLQHAYWRGSVHIFKHLLMHFC